MTANRTSISSRRLPERRVTSDESSRLFPCVIGNASQVVGHEFSDVTHCPLSGIQGPAVGKVPRPSRKQVSAGMTTPNGGAHPETGKVGTAPARQGARCSCDGGLSSAGGHAQIAYSTGPSACLPVGSESSQSRHSEEFPLSRRPPTRPPRPIGTSRHLLSY